MIAHGLIHLNDKKTQETEVLKEKHCVVILWKSENDCFFVFQSKVITLISIYEVCLYQKKGVGKEENDTHTLNSSFSFF